MFYLKIYKRSKFLPWNISWGFSDLRLKKLGHYYYDLKMQWIIVKNYKKPISFKTFRSYIGKHSWDLEFEKFKLFKARPDPLFSMNRILLAAGFAPIRIYVADFIATTREEFCWQEKMNNGPMSFQGSSQNIN